MLLSLLLFWHWNEELEEATVFKMLLLLLLFWHSNEELQEATIFKMLLLPLLLWHSNEELQEATVFKMPPIPGFQMRNLRKPLSSKCYYYCSCSYKWWTSGSHHLQNAIITPPVMAFKWGTWGSHHLQNAITPPIPGFQMRNLRKPLSSKCYYYCSCSCTNKK